MQFQAAVGQQQPEQQQQEEEEDEESDFEGGGEEQNFDEIIEQGINKANRWTDSRIAEKNKKKKKWPYS